MKIVTETIKCDVCGKTEAKSTMLTVVFTTGQTEGRSCKPYLETCTIDLCETCLDKVMSGVMLFASGAQGYNTYYFKGEDQ